MAVSADGATWFLLNAAPDLRQQIESTPALWPAAGAMRSSPIAGVVLTGGDVDAIAGLLTLRERQALSVFATAPVLDVLESNSVFDVLARDLVARRRLALDEAIDLPRPDGTSSGLRCTAFAVPGKVPLYLEADDQPTIEEGERTVGLMLSDGRFPGAGARMFFIPGCAAMTAVAGRTAARRGAGAVRRHAVG